MCFRDHGRTSRKRARSVGRRRRRLAAALSRECRRVVGVSELVDWVAGWLPPAAASTSTLGKLASGRAAPAHVLARPPARRNAAAVRAPRGRRPSRAPEDPRRSSRPELSTRPPGRGASPGAARRGRAARVPSPRRLRPIRQPRRRLEVYEALVLDRIFHCRSFLFL